MKPSYKTLSEIYKKDLDIKSNLIAEIQSKIYTCTQLYDEIQNKIMSCYSYRETVDITLQQNTNRYLLKLNEESMELINKKTKFQNDLDEAKASMLDTMMDMKKLNILVDRQSEIEIYEQNKLEQKESDEFSHRSFWHSSPL